MPWISYLEGGPKRVNHAAVAVGHKIYSFGGYCTGENSREYTSMDVHVLNTTTFRWIQHPVSDLPYFENDDILPYKRYGHTAVVYGDKVYIWGGRNDRASCSTLFCFDTIWHCWTAPKTTGNIPPARDGHSACIWKNIMIIFGGYEEDSDAFARSVYYLDLDKMHWTYVHILGKYFRQIKKFKYKDVKLSREIAENVGYHPKCKAKFMVLKKKYKDEFDMFKMDKDGTSVVVTYKFGQGLMMGYTRELSNSLICKGNYLYDLKFLLFLDRCFLYDVIGKYFRQIKKFKYKDVKLSREIAENVGYHPKCKAKFMVLKKKYKDEFDMFKMDFLNIPSLETRRKQRDLTLLFNTINSRGPEPSLRDFHTTVVIRDRMYLFGGRGTLFSIGRSEILYCNELWYLDLNSWMWYNVKVSGDVPVGRRSHSAFVYDDKMYIFGGYNSTREEHYNHMYEFNPKLSMWRKLDIVGKRPCRRRRQACVVVGDRMFIFGGTSPHPSASLNISNRNIDDKLIDHSDMYVLDFKPTLKTLCILAVWKYHLDESSLPSNIKSDIRNMYCPNKISLTRPCNSAG